MSDYAHQARARQVLHNLHSKDRALVNTAYHLQHLLEMEAQLRTCHCFLNCCVWLTRNFCLFVSAPYVMQGIEHIGLMTL